MRIISTIFFSITTALAGLMIPGCRGVEERVGYVRSDVHAVSYGARYIVSQPASAIVAHAYETAIVTEREELLMLTAAARSSKLVEKGGTLDTRVVCVLWKPDGGTDTLGFGGVLMGFRDDLFELDTLALRMVGTHLSPYMQRQIDGGIEVYREYGSWPEE